MSDKLRPLCQCGNPVRKNGIRKGKQYYYSMCSQCCKKKHKQGTPGNQGGKDRSAIRRETKGHKKDVCERCGFKPKHPCQLDVHHKDCNKRNNAPDNLETLCANCHRLEHSK